jgi:hypothetical protein
MNIIFFLCEGHLFISSLTLFGYYAPMNFFQIVNRRIKIKIIPEKKWSKILDLFVLKF